MPTPNPVDNRPRSRAQVLCTGKSNSVLMSSFFLWMLITRRYCIARHKPEKWKPQPIRQCWKQRTSTLPALTIWQQKKHQEAFGEEERKREIKNVPLCGPGGRQSVRSLSHQASHQRSLWNRRPSTVVWTMKEEMEWSYGGSAISWGRRAEDDLQVTKGSKCK